MKSFSYSIEQLAKFCVHNLKVLMLSAHISQLIIDSRKAKDFSAHLFIAIKGLVTMVTISLKIYTKEAAVIF